VAFQIFLSLLIAVRAWALRILMSLLDMATHEPKPAVEVTNTYHNLFTNISLLNSPDNGKYFDRINFTHDNDNNNHFTALCLGLAGWARTRQSIHPLTPLLIINHSPSTIIDSVLPVQLRAWLSLGTTSLQVLFGVSLSLKSSTSHSIHYFTQSLSSFRNTRPYHYNLFCSRSKIMSFNLSLSFPSVLWCCWLGGRKSIRPVKNWVVVCWRQCLRIRIYVFFRFQKSHVILSFFEMMYQKVVKSLVLNPSKWVHILRSVITVIQFQAPGMWSIL